MDLRLKVQGTCVSLQAKSLDGRNGTLLVRSDRGDSGRRHWHWVCGLVLKT